MMEEEDNTNILERIESYLYDKGIHPLLFLGSICVLMGIVWVMLTE